MYGPSEQNTALSGAIVSVYNAGMSVGGASVGYLADKLSRKWTLAFAAVLGKFLVCIQALGIENLTRETQRQ